MAVKLIHGSETATSLDVERFRREAEAAAALHHPAIVKVFPLGEADGCLYFAMNLVDGESLAAAIRERPLGDRMGAEFVRQIANAGVLHRDLKPSNGSDRSAGD